MREKPDYSDKPTIIVGFDSNEGVVAGITTEGFVLPEGIRVILRDWAHGDEPDENGDLYEDEEV